MKKFALLFTLCFPLVLSAVQPPPGNSVFPLAEVRPGLTATGFSVFKGEEISSFEAEVIDVQQIGAIREPMIICRLKGPFFEKNGVIAAMSGSPLYIGDRFLGAIAMGWSFSKEPICGVTPAEQMTALYGRKAGGGIGTGLPGQRASDLGAYLDSLAERDPLAHGLPEMLEAKGFSVSIGDGGEKKLVSADIEPGSVVGVQLLQGDVELTAFGTVSSVNRDEFLAFGHSFFGLGDVDFPVVRGRVSTVLPSLLFSFKIAAAGDEIGRMTYDSPNGIVLEKGKRARTLPVGISYGKSDGTTEKKQIRIVQHPMLTGMLLETSVRLLHETLEGTGGDLHLSLDRLEFGFEGGGSVVIPPQRFGGGSAPDMMTAFISETYALLAQNIYRKEKLADMKISIRAFSGREEGKLLELRSLTSSVRQGDGMKLDVSFAPFEGEKAVHRITIPTESLPTGEVKVIAGDGLSVYKRVAAGLGEVPSDFESLGKALGGMPRGGTLVYAVLAEREAVYYGGRRVPDLPPSMESGLPSAMEGAVAKNPEKVLIGPLEGPETGYFAGLLEIKVNIMEKEPK